MNNPPTLIQGIRSLSEKYLGKTLTEEIIFLYNFDTPAEIQRYYPGDFILIGGYLFFRIKDRWTLLSQAPVYSTKNPCNEIEL